MKYRIHSLALAVLWLTLTISAVKSQPYTLNVHITGQPENPVLLGWISGDDFHKIDSAKAFNSSVSFDFPADAHPGVYRLIFGKTGYARVMNEDPQTLDFIFNNENIELQTDFKSPLESLNVIRSSENQVYFEFLRRQIEYDKALLIMEKQLDRLWTRKDTAGAIQMADEFNRLQMEWDLRVVQTIQQNSETFASKLISTKRQALKDGFLSPEERSETRKKEFFSTMSFNDEALIYSSAYTDKIFRYLLLFNKPMLSRDERIAAYKKAVTKILEETRENSRVQKFIVDYLTHGFEVLKMPEVIQYIQNNQ
jgi:hypothetical protein